MTELDTLREVYSAGRRETVPLGLRVNDLVVANGISGNDRRRGGLADGLEAQFRAALATMEEVVGAAGGTADNVARGVAYVTRVEDREPVNRQWWDELFPDPEDRPAYKVLLAPLPEGQLVRLDVMAVLGARRRRVDIPNISAADPTVVVGDYVISSRCHGNDAGNGGAIVAGGIEAEARQTFGNLCRLVSIAGGLPADIVQVNTYTRTEAHADAVRAAFEDAFAEGAAVPALNTLVNFVSGSMQCAADMVAVVGGPR
jgi:2-iminobutanoate/2-iminopropanoate deaminase